MHADRERRVVGVGQGPDDPIDAAGRLARLLTDSARGDEIAFADLYDATSARVHGLVLRVVRNHALAEEVSQEVYLQVWRTSSRYDQNKGSALSWLLTIAHRRAVDRVRSTESFTRRDAEYHRASAQVDHDVTADAVESSLEAARVRVALAALTPTQRQALELAYFAGHTHVEIAGIIGIPVGTAKTRIRDGLIKLRGLMDDAA